MTSKTDVISRLNWALDGLDKMLVEAWKTQQEQKFVLKYWITVSFLEEVANHFSEDKRGISYNYSIHSDWTERLFLSYIDENDEVITNSCLSWEDASKEIANLILIARENDFKWWFDPFAVDRRSLDVNSDAMRVLRML